MNQILVKEGRLVYIGAFLLIIGLFTESVMRALPSVTGFTMLLLVLFEKNLKQRVNRFFRSPPLLLFVLWFFVLMFEYFRTEPSSLDFYFQRLQLKSAFPAFVLVFGLSDAFSKKRVNTLFFFFLVVVSVYNLGVLINYAFHFEEYNKLYIQSKIIPTGVNHVRYSLMVAFASVVGAYLYHIKFVVKYAWERKLQLGLVVFGVVFLHIFSVRSGLLALYSSVFVIVLWLLFAEKYRRVGIAVLVGMVLFPLCAYLFFPTVQDKIQNTKNDLAAINDPINANYHSITGRIYTYKVALTLFNTSPWVGVGMGNIERLIHEEYEQSYPMIMRDQRKFPHNQYLRVLTSEGIIGLVLFVFVFYFVLFYHKNYKRSKLLVLHLFIVSISFMFEGTLETQLGINFSSLFLFLPLSSLLKEDFPIE